MAEKKPFEIAREALMLLATRKLIPTPDNYQAVFSEIAGTPHVVPFPGEPMRHIAHALPTWIPAQQKQLELLERAIAGSDWEGVQHALVAYATSGASAANSHRKPAGVVEGARAGGAPAPIGEFLEQLARLIENAMPALGSDDVRFAEQVAHLLKVIREPAADVANLKTLLGNFTHRLSFAAEDQAEIRSTLLKLLHLIIENIGELSLDDSWLKRQIDALMQAATPPLTLRRLDDLERRLKDVMFKQVEAKERTLEAQEEMRRMLATFIARLAQMTDATSTYHNRMEESARLMENAKSL
jgi:diguanylate cyclase